MLLNLGLTFDKKKSIQYIQNLSNFLVLKVGGLRYMERNLTQATMNNYFLDKICV